MRKVHQLRAWRAHGPRDHITYMVTIPKAWIRELKWRGGQPIVLEWHEGDRFITIREATEEEVKEA